MTATLDELRTDVAEVITDEGVSVTFYSAAGPGDYNPGTGSVTHSPTGYVVLASPPEGVDPRFVDGDVVKAGDLTTVVAALHTEALGFVPEPGQDVVIGSETWECVSVESMPHGNPANDEVVAYTCRLRRGP